MKRFSAIALAILFIALSSSQQAYIAAFAGNLEKRGPGFIPGPPSLSRKPVYGLCVGRGSRQIEEDGICHAIL